MLIADATRFSTLKGSKRSYLRSKKLFKILVMGTIEVKNDGKMKTLIPRKKFCIDFVARQMTKKDC